MTTNKDDPMYFMGRSEREAKRLQDQSRLYGVMTERLLRDAGVSPGMKILDIGSGAGDVAMLAAKLVGPQGQVIGTDANPAIVETARQRTAEAGLTNVTFIAGDIREIAGDLDRDFDGVIGRFVLMYIADRVQALKQLVNLVKPGGIIAFQEMDFMESCTSFPDVAIYTESWGKLRQLLTMGGVPTSMSFDLFNLFCDVGLEPQGYQIEAPAGGGTDWAGYDYIANSIKSWMPKMLETGIATPEYAALSESFGERLKAEAIAKKSVIRLPICSRTWATRPKDK